MQFILDECKFNEDDISRHSAFTKCTVKLNKILSSLRY
jgi:hypothetical protein